MSFLVNRFSEKALGAYGKREYLKSRLIELQRALYKLNFGYIEDEFLTLNSIINQKEKRLLGLYMIENIHMTNSSKINYMMNAFIERDSIIALISGARGSGKSALAGYIADLFHKRKPDAEVYWMGGSLFLPSWITHLEDIKTAKNHSMVIIDEAMMTYDSRRAMKTANVEITHVLAVARHKYLKVVFISQLMSGVDKRIFYLADAIIQKKAQTFLLSGEERGDKIFKDYIDIMMPKKIGETLWFDGSKMLKFKTFLPPWWTEQISKAFENIVSDI